MFEWLKPANLDLKGREDVGNVISATQSWLKKRPLEPRLRRLFDSPGWGICPQTGDNPPVLELSGR